MEIDLPFLVVTNVVPYGIVAVLLALRRGGHVRRWPAVFLIVAALYALAISVAPVGEVARAREGWGVYVVLFVLLGTLTWISFGLWWLTYVAWTDRYRLRGPQVSPPALYLHRRSAPALGVSAALTCGLLPWIGPVTSLPGGAAWLIPMAAVALGSAVIAAAVNVSDRAPRFMLPRDLANEPQPPTQPFWVDILFVALMILFGAVPVLAIQASAHLSSRAVWLFMLPVLFAAGLVAFAVSRLVSRLVRGHRDSSDALP